ncbi:MAG: hypothetical protein ACPGUC_05525 [Gammaproteobacteria bacterium]
MTRAQHPISAYSQRILPPFSGVVQIAETNRVRAQSFDGVSWEIHYFSGDTSAPRPKGYALDRGYFRVAGIDRGELRVFSSFPAHLDPVEVTDGIQQLADFLAGAEVPFPAADVFEYWLLDGQDESPLALIFSCCEESQMATYPPLTQWTALPHSKLKVENTPEEEARGDGPVNHRFQDLIARRAGARPRGAWFDRGAHPAHDFPGFLLREDWPQEAHHELCQRYLRRKAPRLLMLQGVAAEDRARMEIAAKSHALEVEEYFPLYPAVHDEALMASIRVEARLRRSMPDEPRARRPDGPKKDGPMGKDMRIFET